MEIPKGNSREEVRARRQIIKDYYAKWIAKHPDAQHFRMNQQVKFSICQRY